MNNTPIDPKTIIRAVLDAIDFTDDKDAFINDFLHVTNIQSLSVLSQTLPHDQQEKLQNELTKNAQEKEHTQNILNYYFTAEQMQQAFENALKDNFMQWIQEIEPTLSHEQKQKLIDIAKQLQQNPD